LQSDKSEFLAVYGRRRVGKSFHGCYCWKGESPAGIGAQIDLVLEWKGERTDYLVEAKFSENIVAIDSD